jgi:hypothetical protein
MITSLATSQNRRKQEKKNPKWGSTKIIQLNE